MDRKTLEEYLQQAQGHVASGRQHIERQRLLVDKLDRDGHDTVAAELLLRTFALLAEGRPEVDRPKAEISAQAGDRSKPTLYRP